MGVGSRVRVRGRVFAASLDELMHVVEAEASAKAELRARSERGVNDMWAPSVCQYVGGSGCARRGGEGVPRVPTPVRPVRIA